MEGGREKAKKEEIRGSTAFEFSLLIDGGSKSFTSAKNFIDNCSMTMQVKQLLNLTQKEQEISTIPVIKYG